MHGHNFKSESHKNDSWLATAFLNASQKDKIMSCLKRTFRLKKVSINIWLKYRGALNRKHIRSFLLLQLLFKTLANETMTFNDFVKTRHEHTDKNKFQKKVVSF